MKNAPPDKVLVTGVSRGIGAAVAHRVATEASRPVVGVYRLRADAAKAVAERAGALVEVLAADLSTPAGMQRVVAYTGRAMPWRFDGVVLNAGVSLRAAFDVEQVGGVDPLEHQIEADLVYPLRLLRDLLNADRISDGASIVVISSNLASRGLPGKVAYAAAKAGLEAAVRGLCHELGPRQIRVNAVAPGLLRTDMTAELGDEGYTAYAAQVPLGRVGEADDVASVVNFLLSDAARYVSGQTITVDGGWSA